MTCWLYLCGPPLFRQAANLLLAACPKILIYVMNPCGPWGPPVLAFSVFCKLRTKPMVRLHLLARYLLIQTSRINKSFTGPIACNINVLSFNCIFLYCFIMFIPHYEPSAHLLTTKPCIQFPNLGKTNKAVCSFERTNFELPLKINFKWGWQLLYI